MNLIKICGWDLEEQENLFKEVDALHSLEIRSVLKSNRFPIVIRQKLKRRILFKTIAEFAPTMAVVGIATAVGVMVLHQLDDLHNKKVEEQELKYQDE